MKFSDTQHELAKHFNHVGDIRSAARAIRLRDAAGLLAFELLDQAYELMTLEEK
jgi:hypothetical protein